MYLSMSCERAHAGVRACVYKGHKEAIGHGARAQGCRPWATATIGHGSRAIAHGFRVLGYGHEAVGHG